MLSPDGFQRRLAGAGTVTLGVVFVVFAALSYWQVFRADLGERADNPRVYDSLSDPARGRILDRDGNVLAESSPDGTRVYHNLSLAHIVGYLSAEYGSQGAELAFNDWLVGKAGGSWESALDAEFNRQGRTGLDVALTIDPAAQAAAAEALGGQAGAVVAMDPRTGEILAMVSFPGFDPSQVEANGENLTVDPSAPLLNRATQGLYPPGSTFKAVTAIGALESGLYSPDREVTCPGELVFDGFPVQCGTQGTGTYPFIDAFTFSVNAMFAQVGVDLGWERLLATAAALGFGSSISFELETTPTSVVGPTSELSEALLASTGFGQGEILASPLQMAMVAAAIANGGVLHGPIIGLGVVEDGDFVERFGAGDSRRALPEDVAATMLEFMESVMVAGQANAAAIDGVRVGGKTGTAESGVEGLSHAWFIGIAPVDDPQVVVAVVVEFGGQGSRVAAPIAGEVMRAVLSR
ncbi:MAG: penicillin-binding transpeptidase domain-containing protein [Dehalococcoidia bacterium]